MPTIQDLPGSRIYYSVQDSRKADHYSIVVSRKKPDSQLVVYTLHHASRVRVNLVYYACRVSFSVVSLQTTSQRHVYSSIGAMPPTKMPNWISHTLKCKSSCFRVLNLLEFFCMMSVSDQKHLQNLKEGSVTSIESGCKSFKRLVRLFSYSLIELRSSCCGCFNQMRCLQYVHFSHLTLT